MLKTERLAQVRQGMTAQSVHFLLLHLVKPEQFHLNGFSVSLASDPGRLSSAQAEGTLGCHRAWDSGVEQILCCINDEQHFDEHPSCFSFNEKMDGKSQPFVPMLIIHKGVIVV